MSIDFCATPLSLIRCIPEGLRRYDSSPEKREKNVYVYVCVCMHYMHMLLNRCITNFGRWSRDDEKLTFISCEGLLSSQVQ